MLYVKSESGEMVPITYSNAYAKCPKCGTMHQIDLADILECTGGDVEEASAFCEKCSAKHMPMFENADKIQSIADRFGVHLREVQRIVKSGLDRDLSLEACLVGAWLALSMESGKEELFSLDDIAAVLGCSREEAAAELEKQGIQGAQISTLPGFEWLLDQM